MTKKLETPFSYLFGKKTVNKTFKIPLTFEENITEKEIYLTIEQMTSVLFFQYNSIDENLYLSCYSSNKSIFYFCGFRCSFGGFINEIDNGFPYKFFFKDNSGKNHIQIDFNVLNNGVDLYAVKR